VSRETISGNVPRAVERDVQISSNKVGKRTHAAVSRGNTAVVSAALRFARRAATAAIAAGACF
jgi:hypothetical protein